MLLSYKPVHLQAQQHLQQEGCVVDISNPINVETNIIETVTLEEYIRDTF